MSVQASFAFSGITTAIINDNDGRSHKLTRNLCNLDEPFLVPLQSTPHDIQQILSKKWVVLVGDSSVRMVHDYLVGIGDGLGI